jgi:hypothetical protein
MLPPRCLLVRLFSGQHMPAAVAYLWTIGVTPHLEIEPVFFILSFPV